MTKLRSLPPSPGGDRRRTSARARAALEVLEGRALLSHIHVARHPGPTAAQVQGLTPVRPPDPHPGPILNVVGTGFAIKSPRLYPFYTGPKRGELNAAGAKAFLDGQGNVVLIGIVAGSINSSPNTPDESEYYVWEINRGLTNPTGLIPGRPGITFDEVVTVAITPDGTTGYVKDLTTGAQTALTADQISVGNDNVKVTVPAALLLPANGAPAVAPTVNFSGLDAPFAQSTFSDITSFVPEFRNFPLSLGPIRHTGHE